MQSRFSIFGHPLHPMLITLPIGLFSWALVADIVYLLTDRDMTWYDISYWTGIAAVVTALVAALPGFGDYVTMALRSDGRGIATLHMLLNLSVVALFVVGAILQYDEGATSGASLTAVVVLHLVGVGLLALSGWLGGELSYRHHLAIIPDDAEQERAEHARHELRPEARPRS
ncbi:MAG TPA: DUF2231 domain-containing protein [Dehalococcoidia bacterium]